ncbi:kynureninase [Synoicihabitans lomoniglobus]|uniref:Kynureninase n=1 Tax=Synoicihabitans lomoniglobus TaxID=2909285 RepID=A0AAE9ZUS5_9BACT|nr:kynureninase [Opitutaceae bacterium LMO-M01]WED64636.1 kynureninase [Opitutaceae bacterium LMO-M01]
MSDDDAKWAQLREEFYLPPGQIYLDGNSLGLLNRRAEAATLQALAAWGAGGISGWEDVGWIDLAERTAATLAPLIGASPAAVGVMAQTTVNLHQLLATLFDPTHASRRVIVADELNFASDTHAIHSHLRQRGLDPATHLRCIKSPDGFTLRTTDILATMRDDVQLMVLPSVLYVSGQLLDLAAITRAAREREILIGWDLSHSIGAVPHELEAQGADFAFWCNYKYLNAGPGAVGGLFLHPRHHDRAPGLAGWWGVRPDQRFSLHAEHVPAPGAARLQIGTPSILGLAPLTGSLALFAAAGGIAAVRDRSLALTAHLLSRADTELAALGFSIVTPRDAADRGGHIALAHPSAGQICPALRAAGVVPDYRHPAVLRLAPVAFYTTRADIDQAIDRLIEIMRTNAHHAWPPVETAAP